MQRPEPVRDLAWDAERGREFADRAVELWQEFLKALPDLPVGRLLPSEKVREAVAIPVPGAPMADDELFAYLRSVVFDWSMYPGHPGFMAYVSGPGTVPGAAADLLAAGLNQNVGGWVLSPAASEIELALTRFFAEEMFGLPEGSGGIITSGGSMANFVGLKAARDHKAGWNVRAQGVAGGPRLTMYMSDETHIVSERAADMLGVGTEQLRKIPVDGRFRVRMDLLREAIAADRAAGMQPFAVVGSAGTVATGAVDPMHELADLCAEEGLWFHVDGAYGGPAVLAPDLRPLFDGIERADSIAFDPHKWLYTPHSGGCVLVRNMAHLAESFEGDASYVHQDKEYTQRGLDLGRHGPQFSRSFWALKVWVSLLAHGRDAYARRISHDAELARYLAASADAHPSFELISPAVLSICCFRYVPQDLEGRADAEARDRYLDLLNERLVADIQLDGRVFPSNAVLGERHAIRVCIVNFRTEADQMDLLLAVAEELGQKADAELRPEELR
ncbi:MAG: aromatic-L-amino-acid/L-tryptophan decarboxylase [Actinomycetota bacterium]|jgi:glutamate/tyrosine decarboxylase-like PLP-dependent enzyme|nr:aromatic-L-amino-acid/L-tryptophan decarboxylase [Actinomycetota bacterium]